MQINLNLENAGSNTLGGGVTTFGQVFSQGELPSGTGLKALVGGVEMAVQLDVKTTYADGSAKMAVLSLERPDIAAGASVAVVLSDAAAPAGGAPVDLAAALAAHQMTVEMTGSGAHANVDVMAALQQALQDGTASFWQKGELATQARVEVPLEGSQRLVFDVTAFKGGGLEVEAQFNNDGAMGATGGRVNSHVTVTLDGQVVARETVNQGQYQNWHETFSTTDHDGGQGLGDASSGWLNIRQDIAHLHATGAIANYDLSIPLNESLLQSYAGSTQESGWGEPLAINGVTQYMPGVGGRADIGITTASTTTWLVTQDIRAATYALGQAETASAVPWNMWDSANGRWLSTDKYPQLWTDIRGGTGIPGDASSGTLTQHGDDISGWSLDSAHQPDLSFVPYILTGERWMLDNLQAQGAWNVVSQWSAMRGDEGNLVVQGNQVRGAAWALRQIDEAAWASPDGSAEKAYFAHVSEANWSWIAQQIPTWTAQQGEAHGWLPGEYGTQGALPPWQQDYFASTAIAAARHGNADAMTYLQWASNFLVGRFEHAADGFPQHDGAAYLLAISDPATGRIFNTWAEIGATTKAYNWSNGDGWSHTDGDYAQLALATLAGIAELTGSQAAVDAYYALVAEHPPFIADSDFAKDPTYAIAAPGADNTPIVIPLPDVITTPVHTVPPAAPSEPATVETPPAAPAASQPGGEVPLSIVLGAEAWEGNPLAVVLVNGVEVFRGEVTANHAQGGAEIALGHVAAGGAHDVVVQFLNDAWGGTADTDRNLFVEDIRINGVSTGSSAALLDGNSDAHFSITAPVLAGQPPAAGQVPLEVPPAAPAAPAASQPGGEVPLSIVLGAEAWEGNPLAVVLVNGVEVFRGEVTAHHAQGGAEIALGHVAAAGAHDVVVQFLNDAWGGTADTDRNLFVEDIRINGVSTGSSAALLDGNSDAHFSVTTPVTAPAADPVAIVSPPVAEHADAPPAVSISSGTLHTNMFWSQSSVSGVTLGQHAQADGGFLGASGLLTGAGGSIAFTNTDVIHFADGRLVFDAADPAAQVMRLYQAALGREPDSIGQEHWTASLTHGASLTQLANGFMGSDEFQSRFGHLDDAGFIVRTYEQVLGRQPDANGMSNWQDHLAHGMSRADMLVGFSESVENRELTQGLLAHGLWDVDDQMADIARLYKAVLDRAPDMGGLQFWDAKADAGMSTAEMANLFAQSNEFQTRFGGASDADFVQMVYANTLGRAGEAAGEAFWVDHLAHGMTRGEVVAGFADSLEFLQLSQPLTDHGIVLG